LSNYMLDQSDMIITIPMVVYVHLT